MPVLSAQFERAISGLVIGEHSPAYDQARSVWNAAIDRKPAAIILPANTADIIRTIDLCNSADIELTVRGGGHSAAGRSTNSGGVVLDLGSSEPFTRIRSTNDCVIVGGGARWRDVDSVCEKTGRYVPGGLVSTTGVGGLTLGGGVGWLMRPVGLTCDRLHSAQVIFADGTEQTVSADSHPDLLWALRGGGSTCCVISYFTYLTTQIKQFHIAKVICPLEASEPLIALYLDTAMAAPDSITAYLTMTRPASGEPLVNVVAVAADDPDGLTQFLNVLSQLGGTDSIDPISYSQLQQHFDRDFLAGNRSYWRSRYLLEDASIASHLIDCFREAPSRFTTIDIEPHGGQRLQYDSTHGAFPHRRPLYNLLVLAMWTDASNDASNKKWADECLRVLNPYLSSHVYHNYQSEAEAGDAESALSDRRHQLRSIAQRYDRESRFARRLSLTPPPAGGDQYA